MTKMQWYKITKPIEERYFVDVRCGIVAIRDHYYTDPDYNGLHSDTPGVVKSWSGVWNGDYWEVAPAHIAVAHEECARYNATKYSEGTFTVDKLYICPICGGKIEWVYYPFIKGKCVVCENNFNEEDFI